MAAEALQLRLATLPVVSLAWLGTVPGVVIAAAAGLNGPGVGRLRVSGASIAWQAPGSGAFGVAVDAAVDGTYVLRDGVDPDKWLQVTVFTAFLSDATAPVYLEEVYGNVMVSDFAAAAVAAGTVNTVTLRIYNVGDVAMEEVRVWLGGLDAELPISGLAGVAGRCRRAEPSNGRGGRGLPVGTSGLSAGVIKLGRGPTRIGGGARRHYCPLPAALGYAVGISSDNVSFYAPREEFAADALVYGPLAVGAYHTLYVRRSIPAGMSADPRGRTDIRTSFSSLY